MQRIIVATLVTLLFSSVASAQFQDCPGCGAKVATGVPKTTKVKKKVYNVECEDIAVPDICIPRPIFCLREQLGNLFKPKCIPGDPCGESCGNIGCTHEPVRSGYVRTIKKLKKKTVECDKCSYKWEVTGQWGCDSSGYSMEPLDSNIPPESKKQPAEGPNQDLQNNEPIQPPSSDKAVFHKFSDQVYSYRANRSTVVAESPYYVVPNQRRR